MVSLQERKEGKLIYTREHDKLEDSIIGNIEPPPPPPSHRVNQGFRYAYTPQNTHVIS